MPLIRVYLQSLYRCWSTVFLIKGPYSCPLTFKFSFDDLFFRVVNRSTFTCPYCYQSNLDSKGLLQHVNNNHKNEQQSVVSDLFDMFGVWEEMKILCCLKIAKKFFKYYPSFFRFVQSVPTCHGGIPIKKVGTLSNILIYVTNLNMIHMW